MSDVFGLKGRSTDCLVEMLSAACNHGHSRQACGPALTITDAHVYTCAYMAGSSPPCNDNNGRFKATTDFDEICSSH